MPLMYLYILFSVNHESFSSPLSSLLPLYALEILCIFSFVKSKKKKAKKEIIMYV